MLLEADSFPFFFFLVFFFSFGYFFFFVILTRPQRVGKRAHGVSQIAIVLLLMLLLPSLPGLTDGCLLCVCELTQGGRQVVYICQYYCIEADGE